MIWIPIRLGFQVNIPVASYKYSLRRALIESIEGGTDVFLSEGTISKVHIANGQIAIQDARTFEAWKHEL